MSKSTLSSASRKLLAEWTLLSWLLMIDYSMKRLIDLVASFLGLVLLAPFFAIIALRLKQDSPGPIFFRGRRAGKAGKEFLMLKFRTMQETPSSYNGAKVTAKDDPRITPFGRWLRDTKLNEFPQLWNVLKGEMSLVGPRPEDPDIVATWPEQARREILSVRPGITSPASVIYRDEESMLTNAQVMQTYLGSIMPSKLRLDQLYVRHHTIWLDLDIIFWTAFAILPQLGSFVTGEEILFLGPITRIVSRYMNWFTIDMVVTLMSIGVAGVLWRLSEPLDIGIPMAIGFALVFSLLFSLAGGLFGIYRISWRYAELGDSVRLALSTLVGMICALIVDATIVSTSLVPPAMIMFASALAFMGFVVVRYRSRLTNGVVSHLVMTTSSAAVAKEHVLILGSGVVGQSVAWFLRNPHIDSVFHVVGFVDDDFYKQGVRFQGINVVGRRVDIPQLVARNDVGIIFFAIQNISSEDKQALLDICAKTQVRVIMIPELLERLKELVADRKPAVGIDSSDKKE